MSVCVLCFFSLLVWSQMFCSLLSQRVCFLPCGFNLTRTMFTALHTSLIKLYRHTCIQTVTHGTYMHTVQVNITELQQQHLACISLAAAFLESTWKLFSVQCFTDAHFVLEWCWTQRFCEQSGLWPWSWQSFCVWVCLLMPLTGPAAPLTWL